MIKVTIVYPNQPGARFDFPYYLGKHMPEAIRLLGAHPGYRGVAVEKGLAGTKPGEAPAYLALCHFSFTSVEDFVAAFMPNAAWLQGDIPNYTDTAPVIQFSEVLLSQ